MPEMNSKVGLRKFALQIRGINIPASTLVIALTAIVEIVAFFFPPYSFSLPQGFTRNLGFHFLFTPPQMGKIEAAVWGMEFLGIFVIGALCFAFVLFIERPSVKEPIPVIEDIRESGGNPILSDSDLTPWSDTTNGSYHDSSSQYYPHAAAMSVDQQDASQTWFPDDDIARTHKGKVKCPHCGHMFYQSVPEHSPHLPPLSMPCLVCRRTITIR